MSSESPQKPYKRKRKKTFLQNARKYAKKGYYGRGSHMEADTYQYFVRILEVFKQGFENDEDKAVFVDNVFEQTLEKEIECSCNQVGCRVIEMLLPFASNSVLERFMSKFGEDLRPLCQDRFASFVIQALVKISCSKPQTYSHFAIKISKFLLNNLEDYAWDNFGNRIIRTCLCAFMNIPEDNKLLPETTETISEEFTEIVKDYGERFIVWPQFSQLCTQELTSGLLQVLLKAIKKADKKLLKKYLQKLLDENFISTDDNNDALPPAFMSTSLQMLLETSIQVAPKKLLKLYCQKLFEGRMLKLSTMKTSNFAVQKLLNQCTDKEQFEALFDELMDNFQDIIKQGHPGVLLAICQNCKRLSARQGPFIQSLIKSLNCSESEQQFIMSVSRLTPYNPSNAISNENLAKDKLNLQGTLMLQQMLEFNKPIKIVNSLLNMDLMDLKNLFSNSMGSHIVDSYVTSPFVGEKSREKLTRKMKGTYQELAASKYGSRSFEAIFNAANMKTKTHIMEELAYRDGSWANTDHGRIIAAKINLALYKRDKESWKNSFNKVVKPEEVMADVLK
ncbi:unnamed protein product [Ceutorhynchus assimilis]|uniref:Nucleolar protein 9 n=1 Tax=Ceutorhynchus assimilis TaxID=467358 RepID=A0A9N9MJ41_9CUCU|nr:unnamed protein product [Ceutorhynchus assimilis]